MVVQNEYTKSLQIGDDVSGQQTADISMKRIVYFCTNGVCFRDSTQFLSQKVNFRKNVCLKLFLLKIF